MTLKEYRKRIKWLQFPNSTDGAREYEVMRRLKKEGNADVLEREVCTSQNEIIQMAHLVDAADGDSARFLQILRQDAEQFGVSPEEVYDDDDLTRDGKWSVKLTTDQVRELHNQSNKGINYSKPHQHEAIDDMELVVQRLEELHEFLSDAASIDLAPKLYQG